MHCWLCECAWTVERCMWVAELAAAALHGPEASRDRAVCTQQEVADHQSGTHSCCRSTSCRARSWSRSCQRVRSLPCSDAKMRAFALHLCLCSCLGLRINSLGLRCFLIPVDTQRFLANRHQAGGLKTRSLDCIPAPCAALVRDPASPNSDSGCAPDGQHAVDTSSLSLTSRSPVSRLGF